jgi:small subunit ribosomal protein S1
MAAGPDEQTPEIPMSNGDEDYGQLIDDYSHFAPPAEGEVLQGTVLSVTDKDVIVDFGYKSEGLVPKEQFALPDGSFQVRRGDTIDVMVDRQGIQPEGYILLSHTRASRLRAWDNLEKAHHDGLILSGRVLGRVKGGLWWMSACRFHARLARSICGRFTIWINSSARTFRSKS